MYCQNRYYDPANGRWLTRDPIGTAGGVNLYSYCGAGPVGNADASGLFRLIIIGDNSRVPLGDFGGRLYLPWPEGDDRTNWGRDMSKKEILEAMIYCDEFYFYGHGNAYGDLQLDDGEWITSEDIAYVFRWRAMLGRGKMKNVYLGACWSCRTKDSVNLWLLLTMELTGYPEGTAAKWPPQINFPRTFRSPVRRNPGNEWSPAIGDPKLEATFAEKKGRKRIGKRKG